jgi:hypothetical protein
MNRPYLPAPCMPIGRYRGVVILNDTDCHWMMTLDLIGQGLVVGEIGSIRMVSFIPGRDYKIRKKLLRQFYRPRPVIPAGSKAVS